MDQIPLARVCETRSDVSILKSLLRHPIDNGRQIYDSIFSQRDLTAARKTFTTLCEEFLYGRI
jgi:hypothetical protein